MLPRRPLLVLSLLLLARPAAAEVLVVDAAGGGEFTSLVTAVAAASDGDTLLVRPGDYREFGEQLVLGGRSLSIVAEGGGPVLVNAVQASAGAAGQRLLLRGLSIEAGTFDPTTVGLFLAGGDVFLENCSVLGRDGHPAFANAFGGGALVITTGRIVLVNCLVEGGRGSDSSANTFVSAQPGGRGIQVLGAATVALHGCSVRGGRAGDHVPQAFGTAAGSVGGIGLSADSSALLLVSGSSLAGGDGGNGDQIPGSFSAFAYAGGDAVQLSGSATLAQRDSTLLPGAPGVDGAGQPGSPGLALDAGPNNTLVAYPDAHRVLAFGAPAPEGGTLELDYAGAAGDLVGLFLSFTTAAALPPVKQGLFHLGAPLLGPYLLGPAGATGALSASSPMPDLGFGPEDAALVHAQALVKPVAGPVLLSGPTTQLLIDAGL